MNGSASGAASVSAALRAIAGRSLDRATFWRRPCSEGRLTLWQETRTAATQPPPDQPEPARKSRGVDTEAGSSGIALGLHIFRRTTGQEGRQRPRREVAARHGSHHSRVFAAGRRTENRLRPSASNERKRRWRRAPDRPG